VVSILPGHEHWVGRQVAAWRDAVEVDEGTRSSIARRKPVLSG
jgi:hypothetical protein